MNNFKCSLCPFVVNSNSNGWSKHMKSIHGIKKPHRCEICEKSFLEKNSLNTHKKLHKDRIKCPQCEKTYKHRSSLRIHLRNHYEGIPLVPCPKCQKVMQHGSLPKHLLFHKEKEANPETSRRTCGHPKKPVQCGTCGKSISSKRNLQQHQVACHSTARKRTPCHICGVPVLPENYNRHIRSCSGRIPFSCYFCGRKSGTMQNLMGHMASFHTKEKPSRCNKCPFRGATENTLRAHHRYRHNTNKRVPCYFCGKLFPRRENVRTHVKLMHIKEKPYQCGYCSKRFTLSNFLKAHMKTGGRSVEDKLKHGVKLTDGKVECPKCLKVVMKTALRSHLRIHDPSRHKSECRICSKILRKDYLKRHIKTYHTNREIFTCEECGKTFPSRDCLTRHKICKHQRRARTTCPQCHAYVYVDNFNRHLLNTHGPPRFVCYFCGKAFKKCESVNHHMLMEHVKEKPFKCDQCPNYREFSPWQLQRHLSTQH